MKGCIVEWAKLRLRVQTPLFTQGWSGGGGVTVRARGVRGALGFWLRAVIGARVGNDLGRLAEYQRAVFGGTACQSPVLIRVVDESLLPEATYPPWLFKRPGAAQGPIYGMLYLLGQGLADRRDGLKRDAVQPGSEFTVALRLPPDGLARDLVWASLWCARWFGGLGARARRGYGRFEIVNVDCLIPPWFEQRPQWDSVADGVGGVGLPVQLKELVDGIRLGEPALLDAVPQYPRFGHDGDTNRWASARQLDVRAGSESFKSWDRCLSHLGREWQLFRRDRDMGSPQRQTSEWLRTVNGSAGSFPLGVLGLPVVFTDAVASKEAGSAVTVTVDLIDKMGEPLRLASPMWLTALDDAEGQWRAQTLTFVHDLCPAGAAPGVKDLARARGWSGLDPHVLRASHRAWLSVGQTRPLPVSGGAGVAGSGAGGASQGGRDGPVVPDDLEEDADGVAPGGG